MRPPGAAGAWPAGPEVPVLPATDRGRAGLAKRVGPMTEAGIRRIAFNLLLAVMIYVAVTGGG